MSGFTPSTKESFEFEGDTVEVVFNRLKRKDLQKWSQHIKADGDVVKMTFSDKMEMSNVLCDLLTAYIVSFHGLKTADGAEIGLGQVLEEAYFSELTAAMIAKLFKISNLSKEEAKNSGGLSVDTLKG